jgi:hypothetical protein
MTSANHMKTSFSGSKVPYCELNFKFRKVERDIIDSLNVFQAHMSQLSQDSLNDFKLVIYHNGRLLLQLMSQRRTWKKSKTNI